MHLHCNVCKRSFSLEEPLPAGAVCPFCTGGPLEEIPLVETYDEEEEELESELFFLGHEELHDDLV